MKTATQPADFRAVRISIPLCALFVWGVFEATAAGRIESAPQSEAPTEKPAATGEGREFWSFLPLRRVEPPPVQHSSWCRTPVDRFVMDKLEAKGLLPNPPIDRRKLIRRAFFDVVGLPPTPDEVERFVNDAAPDAFERLIDCLLENPHYGERWGRHWLDLARFAESHGYEQDYDRPNAYHYRDFVIKALNHDMPYDQFVKWQIAGDEFAPDDPLALMATGFLAAGTHATQITANQAEKERYDELDDMARTIGTTMLGITIGCARCHDHKYDPIPTADYYGLIATFSTTVRSDFDVNLDPAGFREAKQKFDTEHTPLVAALEKFEREQLPGRFDAWRKSQSKLAEQFTWMLADPVEQKSEGEATFTKVEDGSLVVGGKNPDNDTYTLVLHSKQKGIRAIRLEALAHPSLVKGGPGRAANGNFGLSDFHVVAAPLGGAAQSSAVKLVNPRSTFDQNGLPVTHAIDDKKDTCWAVDPQFGKNHAAVFEFETPVGFDDGTRLTITLEFKCNKQHGIGRPRISLSTETSAGLDVPPISEPAFQALAALDADPAATLTDEQRTAVLKWYRTIDPEWQKWNAPVQEHAKQSPQPKLAKVLISSEGVPAVRLHTQGLDFYDPTYHLKRGDPNQKGEVAAQGFLQAIMRSPDGAKHWIESPPAGCKTSYRRRALANWLTDSDQGAGHLLARVIVNRLWYYHIGRGIVATPSDFGKQGERPTHPELLDWLATELVRNGWRLKPIHKLIMTSAVYVQSNATDETRLATDRDNTLFWHWPGRRLEAEVIRDSMLAVSGSLDAAQFGPGTLDPKQRRRSIYFFVKRSQLVPMMTLFDGPDTLQDLPCRVSTTIAPQALMLMNGATIREYATNFASRLKPQVDGSLADAVRLGYAIALGRAPAADELDDSTNFLEQQAAAYRSSEKSNALDLALADFCQTLVSLNEFLYVE